MQLQTDIHKPLLQVDTHKLLLRHTAHTSTILSVNTAVFAGIKDKNFERFDSGVRTFATQGNVHHYIGLAELAPGEKPEFLQMYIYDSEHEVANRTISQPNVQLDSSLIELLQEELHEFNAHVKMFKAFNIAEGDPRAKIVLLSDTGVQYFSLVLPYTIALDSHIIIGS